MYRYLNILPFYPLVQMLRMQLRYGWMPLRKWQLVLIWFFKLILLEPFRIVEAIVMALLPEKEGKLVFVLGYYRSGTTYLQELLAADKSRRTMTVFQSVLPEIAMCFGWLFVPLLTAIAKVFKARNAFHNIPYDWNFPGEEDVAINALSSLYDYNKIYQYPSRYDELTDLYLKFADPLSEQRWVERYRYLIKKLRYIHGNNTLVLKSPPNTGRVALLKRLFPEASFVFIHRDPAEAVQSAKRLWKLNEPFSFERYTGEQIEELLIRQYVLFYQQYREQTKDAYIPEVRFDDLIRHPEEQIKEVCEKLQLPCDAATLQLVKALALKRTKTPSSPGISGRIAADPAINTVRRELGYAEAAIECTGR